MLYKYHDINQPFQQIAIYYVYVYVIKDLNKESLLAFFYHGLYVAAVLHLHNSSFHRSMYYKPLFLATFYGLWVLEVSCSKSEGAILI
ncbi:hypothetical protein K450DRAFT_254536 [Umbelopsis ramanniana AG]|uniref:Uncharacterized protein n=1 Tax=Umbelopsis ramanniana AG TaxID=1314678 RepID=A0AAD5HAF2_UMBRA|nr:uncharacterized protein K450DRAFT_254536 [Umbelopsis ramanniana AG]KAI8576842.1 hypothetical protein K450DRAFT_254536 [Umbelopsis ramanniana AG]